jgi:hypothetical protein
MTKSDLKALQSCIAKIDAEGECGRGGKSPNRTYWFSRIWTLSGTALLAYPLPSKIPKQSKA